MRAVIEDARRQQTERALAVLLELGVPESELLRVAVRSWVALAEQALVDGGINSDLTDDELVGYLERSLGGVVGAVVPGASEALFGVPSAL